MEPAETRYVELDGAVLAYQVFGSGEHDILVNPDINGHLDLMWTDPHTYAIFERMARTARVLLMQRRGVGLSGQSADCPTVEQQADDILGVMDAAGFRRATLMGILSTCAPVALVAARAPERVKGLVLAHPFATGAGSPDAVEYGWPSEVIPGATAAMLEMVNRWGAGLSIGLWDPVQDTPYNRRLVGLMERASATPMAALAYYDYLINQNFAEIFRSVDVPTRVLEVAGGNVPTSVPRRVAELMPRAELLAMPPTPRGAAMGEAWRPIFDSLLEFASGVVTPVDADRRIATVLFTDIVGSTDLLGRIGDESYRQLRDQHERDARLAIEQGGGRLINVAGDGTLSLFDSATDAVRCARAICQQANDQQIQVRAGVHTGELEQSGGDVVGMTVHVGARIAGLANGGEILVSRLVKDLLLGSDLEFAPHGIHALKGVRGEHELFAVVSGSEARVPSAYHRLKAADRFTLTLARRAPSLMRRAVALGNAAERMRTAGAGASG